MIESVLMNFEQNLNEISRSKYEGAYKNGKKNGVGKFDWPDGSYYLGEFVENEIEGKGKYFW